MTTATVTDDPSQVISGYYQPLNQAGRNAYLRLLVDNGWPQAELARVTGLTRQAVHNRLRRADLGALPPGDHPIPTPTRARAPRKPLVGVTRSGLVIPDAEAVSADAVRAVTRELDRITDPVNRLRRCSELLHEAHQKVPAARRARNDAALGLWLHSGVQGVWRAAGWSSPKMFFHLRRTVLGKDFASKTREQLAREAKRVRPADAYDLYEAVTAYLPLQARAEWLETARATLARELADQGMSRAELAEIMGVTESRAAYITRPQA